MQWKQLRKYLVAICALATFAGAPAETQSQGAWTQAGVLTCRLIQASASLSLATSRRNAGFSPESATSLRGSHQHGRT